MNKAIFLSSNKDKVTEIKRIFKKLDNEKGKFEIIELPEEVKIYDLQTQKLKKLIDNKIIEGYKLYKRPVIAEHTVLKIHALRDYPNTQTEFFVSSLHYDGICNIMKSYKDKRTEVETIIAYCNGKKIYYGIGKTKGKIADIPKGKCKFGWDNIFIPEGSDKTLAELNEEEMDTYSTRYKAAEELYSQIEKVDDNDETIGIKDEVIDRIANRILKKKLVLFIGAGMSNNIGAPTWNELIEHLSINNDCDFGVSSLLGNNLELAEYFTCYYDSCKNEKAVLKEVANIFDEDYNELKSSEIYKMLVSLNVDTIYTTNYDRILEKAYEIHSSKKAETICSLQSLSKSDPDKVHIVKFHGDIKEPENLVLTQSSYYKRYDFENALDILLRKDLLTKSFLFLGYGFGDNNLKYMFYKLNTLWTNVEGSENRPDSYMFLTENNPVQRKILEDKYKITTIVSEELDKGKAVGEFLEKLNEAIRRKS